MYISKTQEDAVTAYTGLIDQLSNHLPDNEHYYHDLVRWGAYTIIGTVGLIPIDRVETEVLADLDSSVPMHTLNLKYKDETVVHVIHRDDGFAVIYGESEDYRYDPTATPMATHITQELGKLAGMEGALTDTAITA